MGDYGVGLNLSKEDITAFVEVMGIYENLGPGSSSVDESVSFYGSLQDEQGSKNFLKNLPRTLEVPKKALTLEQLAEGLYQRATLKDLQSLKQIFEAQARWTEVELKVQNLKHSWRSHQKSVWVANMALAFPLWAVLFIGLRLWINAWVPQEQTARLVICLILNAVIPMIAVKILLHYLPINKKDLLEEGKGILEDLERNANLGRELRCFAISQKPDLGAVVSNSFSSDLQSLSDRKVSETLAKVGQNVVAIALKQAKEAEYPPQAENLQTSPILKALIINAGNLPKRVTAFLSHNPWFLFPPGVSECYAPPAVHKFPGRPNEKTSLYSQSNEDLV